jgi:probable rRNA maturation factor
VTSGGLKALSITAQTGRTYVPFLRKHVTAAHRLLGSPLSELSIALVGDRKMVELHREFMSIDGPTDVLTFPIDSDARGRVTSGEVVICIPYARQAAQERKIPPEREVLLYAIHGMLHLLGHDDRTASAYRTMHRTEDDLLTKMGLGPVFSPASPASSRRSRARSARRR